MKVTFDFYDASITRPAKSGRYLIMTVYPGSHPYVDTITYSRTYDAFNVEDSDQNADHSIKADYWAPSPEWLKDVHKTFTDELTPEQE